MNEFSHLGHEAVAVLWECMYAPPHETVEINLGDEAVVGDREVQLDETHPPVYEP